MGSIDLKEDTKYTICRHSWSMSDVPHDDDAILASLWCDDALLVFTVVWQTQVEPQENLRRC